MQGTSLGPYEIREQLGAGGMGEVWLAEDTRLGRQVAIKVLPEEFASDPERLARFAQEARAAAALNHPHIAAVYDVGHESGVHFMVQELLDGAPLRELLGAPLKLERALSLAIEIANALQAAHKGGIVHRDLKPENVFVTEDGHAKVLDFGLAKLTEMATGMGTQASMSPTMLGTRAGEVMGTAGYMAPEQAQGEEVDHRADLFALGCVLYEMVTGRRPFEGENVYETLGKIVSKEPEPLDAALPDAPAELQRVVRKLLAKEPGMRCQTAGDAVVDLRMLLRDLESGRLETTPAAAESSEAATPVRGLSPLLVGALVVLTAATAAFASRWLQPEAPPGPIRNFSFAYPESHPYRLACCGSSVLIAPDASYVAFFAAERPRIFGTGWQLFVRPLDTLEVRRVEAVNGYMPAMSPDGEWIAFTRLDDDGDNPRLSKIALAGGAPFDLGVDEPARVFWAEDGYIYLSSFGVTELRRIPENGGEVEVMPLTGLPDGTAPFTVATVPGAGIAFVDLRADGPPSGIAIVDLVTLEASTLLDEGTDPRWIAPGHLLWARRGVIYAAPFDLGARDFSGKAVPILQGVTVDFMGGAQLAVAADGTLVRAPGAGVEFERFTSRLVLADAEGGSSDASVREEAFRSPRLSPDGGRIAAGIFTEDGTDVWILDLAQNSLTRLTSDGGYGPIWSPDGDWVYFTRDSDAGPGTEIWRRRADFSAAAEPVLQQEGRQIAEALTPEGTGLVYRLAFEAGEDGGQRSDLWLLPLEGGDPTPIVQSEDRDGGAEVSPDGRLLAYTSDESGTTQVYVRELEGTRRWTASPDFGRGPRWSADGTRLYFTTEGNQGYAVVDVAFDGEYRQSPPSLHDLPDGGFNVWDVTAEGRVLTMQPSEDFFGAESGPGARIDVTLNWFQELERFAPRER
jgi:serine/threonine-protein kinase